MSTNDRATRPSCVVLAAGRGSRLLPHTRDIPKPLVKVGADSILERTLLAASSRGVAEFRIVIGHMGSKIQERFGQNFDGAPITYVANDAYAESNSSLSLAMGLAGLVGPTWVVEGDIVFAAEALDDTGPDPITWLVDSKALLEGNHLEWDSTGVTTAVHAAAEPRALPPHWGKSAGILHLSAEGVVSVRTLLDQAMAAGRQKDYYDTIFGDHLSSLAIRAKDIAGVRWYEVDTPEDLTVAESLFR